MPWHIEKSVVKCSASQPWAVIKDSGGSVAGCHETQEKANKQLAALYANEKSEDPMGEHRAPPREDLCRSAPFELVRTEGDPSDGLTIEGYGAVFNSVTRIDSWEGTFDEVILPGAFRKTLRERTPKMQFDHGRHTLLGSLPLGVWTTAEEDARGLHLIGRLTDNWLITPFRDAIRDGGVEGMSFRFSVEKDKWYDTSGVEIKNSDELLQLLYTPGDRGPLLRKLIEVKASEAGPVVWPAYAETAVGVRSVTIDLGRLSEPAERDKLARAVIEADRHNDDEGDDDGGAGVREPRRPKPVDPRHTQTSVPDRAEQEDKPLTTTVSAGYHSISEPVLTQTVAGEHSSATTRDQLREVLAKVTASIEGAEPPTK